MLSKGENAMKKNILIGIFSPLFYFLVGNIMRYTIFVGEYREEYALLNNILIRILPALPGIPLMFLLIRNSIKEYFKALSTCFCISFVVMTIYIISGIDLMIHTAITGYEEFSLGDGLMRVLTFQYYLAACLLGAIVAGVTTYVKKRKSARILEKQ